MGPGVLRTRKTTEVDKQLCRKGKSLLAEPLWMGVCDRLQPEPTLFPSRSHGATQTLRLTLGPLPPILMLCACYLSSVGSLNLSLLIEQCGNLKTLAEPYITHQLIFL